MVGPHLEEEAPGDAPEVVENPQVLGNLAVRLDAAYLLGRSDLVTVPRHSQASILSRQGDHLQAQHVSSQVAFPTRGVASDKRRSAVCPSCAYPVQRKLGQPQSVVVPPVQRHAPLAQHYVVAWNDQPRGQNAHEVRTQQGLPRSPPRIEVCAGHELEQDLQIRFEKNLWTLSNTPRRTSRWWRRLDVTGEPRQHLPLGRHGCLGRLGWHLRDGSAAEGVGRDGPCRRLPRRLRCPGPSVHRGTCVLVHSGALPQQPRPQPPLPRLVLAKTSAHGGALPRARGPTQASVQGSMCECVQGTPSSLQLSQNA
mmetsp:Transcript_11834/g.38001  ORF Transcript_11834/g.38001 Transcript_11834/m.38001 type:complete len:310 (+) Transcript_11834:735-1664(+)